MPYTAKSSTPIPSLQCGYWCAIIWKRQLLMCQACNINRLESLSNDKPDHRGKHGLSQTMMKGITQETQCAIKIHSATGDIAALCHDLLNGITLDYTVTVIYVICAVYFIVAWLTTQNK